MNRIALSIPRFRNELFGFSIITIIIFHFFEDVVNSGTTTPFTGAAEFYLSVFYSMGVDIFLFLSGMGLFYSMSKPGGAIPFLKRRISRILPAYALIGGIGWFILDLVVGKKSFLVFLSDFTTVSFWTEGVVLVWYISFIMVMYLLFPLIYKMLTLKNRALSNALTVILILCVIGGSAALSFINYQVYDNLEIALWRIIIFVIGAWFGRTVFNGEKLTYEFYLLVSLSLVFIALTYVTSLNKDFLWGIFGLRLQSVFYPVLIIIIATGIISLFDGKAINKALRRLGEISLELYLSHVMVRAIFKAIGLPTYYARNYMLVIAISFAAAIGVHRLLGFVKAKRG